MAQVHSLNNVDNVLGNTLCVVSYSFEQLSNRIDTDERARILGMGLAVSNDGGIQFAVGPINLTVDASCRSAVSRVVVIDRKNATCMGNGRAPRFRNLGRLVNRASLQNPPGSQGGPCRLILRDSYGTMVEMRDCHMELGILAC